MSRTKYDILSSFLSVENNFKHLPSIPTQKKM